MIDREDARPSAALIRARFASSCASDTIPGRSRAVTALALARIVQSALKPTNE
ncbi:hypothetical protein ACVWVY_007707 [Bradyrhizobium sp. URHC0002]